MRPAGRWTDEEVATLLELVKTHSYAVTGEKLGRTKESVRWKMNQLGLGFSPEEAKRRQYLGGAEGRATRYAVPSTPVQRPSPAFRKARRIARLMDEATFWDDIDAVAKEIEGRGRAWVADLIRRTARYRPRDCR